MSEIVKKLQKQAIRSLNLMAKDVLKEHANIPSVATIRAELLFEFEQNLNRKFGELEGKVKSEAAVVDFETLSLVKEEELDTQVAIEGMIAAARNLHLPSFISFNARLNSLFPGTRIDESSNPLDPEQIASSFTAGVTKLQLNPHAGLALFRTFNEIVLKHIDKILHDANTLLINHGVIPNLRMDSKKGNDSPNRHNPRPGPRSVGSSAFDTVEEETYSPNPEQPGLFAMMRNLLRGDSGTASSTKGAGANETGEAYVVPASMIKSAGGIMRLTQPEPGTKIEVVDQGQLMGMLSDIQKSIGEKTSQGSKIPSDMNSVDKLDITTSLGERLAKGQDDGVVKAIDQQSSDIFNLVTMLYDAIWKDESVPLPIKALIGRTQITIIKVALTDIAFFNKEDHAARMLLNEFAAASIGWTEKDNLDNDPLYRKMESLINKTIACQQVTVLFFEDLIADFQTFLAVEAAKSRRLEQRILKAKERSERLDDIHELVKQKISERILGREIDSFVSNLLETYFHKFMVMLVLKEGPGSNAWKQSINTIDVLLWSVQPHEHEEDKQRLKTVNPRLLNNLRKALRIARVDTTKIEAIIPRLMEVQQKSFTIEVDEKVEASPTNAGSGESETVKMPARKAPVPEKLLDDDPVFTQVDSLAVGVWVEFAGPEENQAVRCKLAAKINAIDKFIFVNRQGVKVVEKTRIGLARELKDNTVKIISDGLLLSRALESVIGVLRETTQQKNSTQAESARQF